MVTGCQVDIWNDQTIILFHDANSLPYRVFLEVIVVN